MTGPVPNARGLIAHLPDVTKGKITPTDALEAAIAACEAAGWSRQEILNEASRDLNTVANFGGVITTRLQQMALTSKPAEKPKAGPCASCRDCYPYSDADPTKKCDGPTHAWNQPSIIVTAAAQIAEQLRDDGIQAAAAANPNAVDAAVRIIEELAAVLPSLSANTTWERFELAQIPGPARAGAWKRAESRHIVADAGREEPSINEAAHGKRVRVYKSLRFAA